jgi:hypothetical protein
MRKSSHSHDKNRARTTLRVATAVLAMVAVNLPILAATGRDENPGMAPRSHNASLDQTGHRLTLKPGESLPAPAKGRRIEPPLGWQRTLFHPGYGQRLRAPRSARHSVAPKTARQLRGTPSSRLTGASRRPVVKALSKPSGPVVGGQRIVISGANFRHLQAVEFGPLKAQSVRLLSATRIQVSTPAHWTGTAMVRVHTRIGWSSSSPAAQYRFLAPKSTSSASYVSAPGTSVLAEADVLSVSGGDSNEFPVSQAPKSQPWQVTLAQGASAPGVGSGILLKPGSPVYPTGLSGVVTAIAADTGGDPVLTVAPQMTGVFKGPSCQRYDVADRSRPIASTDGAICSSRRQRSNLAEATDHPNRPRQCSHWLC